MNVKKSYNYLLLIASQSNKILNDPERYYNLIYKCLLGCGVCEIKQTAINYNKTMSLLFYAVNTIESLI